MAPLRKAAFNQRVILACIWVRDGLFGSKRSRARYCRIASGSCSHWGQELKCAASRNTNRPMIMSYKPEQVSEDLHANELKASIDRAWRITSYFRACKGAVTVRVMTRPLRCSALILIRLMSRMSLSWLIRTLYLYVPRGACPGTFCTPCLRRLNLPSQQPVNITRK